MFARGSFVCTTILVASVAKAGGVLDLVPDRPGPYLFGETLDVTFLLQQDPAGQPKNVRLMQFDMNASDPALTLDSFTFDFSAQELCRIMPSLCGLEHSSFEDLSDGDGAIVTNVFTGAASNDMNQIIVPESGLITVGHLELTLPTMAGVYTLDAMNAAATGQDEGARVQFGPGCTGDCEWSPRPDPIMPSLTGGTLDVTVVPEPATLVLLGLSALGILHRRRES